MTVVLEDQVKTITAEIEEQFGHDPADDSFDKFASVTDVVRAVIAQYDISTIARLEVPVNNPNYWAGI